MAEKKQETFTVTDRRLFTSEGELRQEGAEEKAAPAERPAPGQVKAAAPERPAPAEVKPTAAPTNFGDEAAVPPPPTAAEQKEQADAYRKSSKDLDARIELSGRSAKDLEMTFERFLASLYMTAMLQLGLMHEEGAQPRLDVIGARQTIDTLSLLGEKTKGNLTMAEETFLQNSLYEVRMAYVEVTNALARPPKAPVQSTGT